MKTKIMLAAISLALTAQVSAAPAMSVFTINADDPMGYMKWAEKSGPAIGKAIDASLGGVCAATAGYYAPGELYYWHIFPDHATAMAASIYNESVQKELGKLDVRRSAARADAYRVVLGEPADLEEGDTFSNWNIVVATDEPERYVEQVAKINAAADENGFEDASLAVYAYLTGEEAGNMLVVVQAPSENRLGAFLDQMDSQWLAPIMADLSEIRTYRRGFMMNCTVVYSSD